MTNRRPIVRFGLAAALLALALVGAYACGGGDDEAALSRDPAGFTDSSGEAVAPDAGAVEGDEGRDQGASPSTSGQPGEAPEASPDLQVVSRKIIQTTSVDLEVEDVARQFQEIFTITDTAAGHIVSSSFSNDDDDQAADITIRVPGEAYQDVLRRLRGLGDVAAESSDANDVTEEYSDLGARIRTLEATEQRYLDLLARAETIPDILTVQDRLDSVRGQIEQVQGRINLLDGLTELATITVHLRPLAAAAGGGGPQPLEAAEAAWEASLQAVRGVATVTLAVAVFSWWLVPPLIAAGVIWGRFLRGRPGTPRGTSA